MFDVLRRRNFSLLWTGGIISSIGDGMLFVALPFYVYLLSGSALATGAMFLAETLPRLIMGSLAGVFVDRWDRRATMIASDLLRAVLILCLLSVHSTSTLWVVYVVAAVQSMIGQFFDPARGALLPRLLPEKDLLQANSLGAVSSSVAQLVGPALGGALFAALGLPGVVLFDSASFLCSAMLIFLIQVPALMGQPAIAARAQASVSRVLSEWREGLNTLLAHRVLRTLLISSAVAMFGQGIINAIIVVFVKADLHGTAQTLGWMVSAQGAGGLLGGLLVGQVGRRVRPAYLLMLGGVTCGAVITAVVISNSVPVSLVLITILGIVIVGYFVSFQTLLQRATPDALRGRVFGTLNAVNAVMMVLGIALASTTGNAWGAGALLIVAGSMYAAAGLLSLPLVTEVPLDAPVQGEPDVDLNKEEALTTTVAPG